MDWSSCRKTGALLYRADLTDANLNGAKMPYANLRNTILSDADLTDVQLRYSYLRWVNLERANLSGASLVDSDLGNANLRGAKLGAGHSQATCNHRTTWPDGTRIQGTKCPSTD